MAETVPRTPRLSVRDARLGYRGPDGAVNAVDGVSFDIHPGETLGIVGESGCGKSSLARLITGLADRSAAASGQICLDGRRLDTLDHAGWTAVRRRLQYVFQDPLGALDPRMSILAQVREPLDIHRVGARGQRTDRARRLLESIGIGAHLHASAPVEISGGQRQRVVLARALILEPDVLLCDEPVSALDVSIQAQILALLGRLRDELGLTTLFISHDLAVVRHVSQRVAVMYLGRFVEIGPVDGILARPGHPYTRALIDAVPGRRRLGGRFRLAGDTPRPSARPPGCALAGRCPFAAPRCRQEEPALAPDPADPAHLVACHFPHAIEAAA